MIFIDVSTWDWVLAQHTRYPSVPSRIHILLFLLNNFLTTRLTKQVKYVHTVDIMKTYSTAQVATVVGVAKKTILRWLYRKAVPEPKWHRNGGVHVRIWTERDVARVRKYKDQFYRKGRGRKKAESQSGNR